MKKIALFLVVACTLCLMTQCESSTPNGVEQASTCDNPDWLSKFINSAAQNGIKGKVIRYQYNGEIVFSVDACVGCPDDMVVVYNCAGETRCQFGGIAGVNTCPDFTDKAVDEKIIWSN